MTKGCYRGQEIVARVMHRGHLDRRLGAVALGYSQPPLAGAEVRREGKRIGEVTSSISSPKLGRPLALAILKTEFLNPGTPVEVVYGESTAPGEVVKVPLTCHTAENHLPHREGAKESNTTRSRGLEYRL